MNKREVENELNPREVIQIKKEDSFKFNYKSLRKLCN